MGLRFRSSDACSASAGDRGARRVGRELETLESHRLRVDREVERERSEDDGIVPVGDGEVVGEAGGGQRLHDLFVAGQQSDLRLGYREHRLGDFDGILDQAGHATVIEDRGDTGVAGDRKCPTV